MDSVMETERMRDDVGLRETVYLGALYTAGYRGMTEWQRVKLA